MVKKEGVLLIFFVALQNLYGVDTQIYCSPEYNRAFNFCWDIAAVGSVNLNNRYTIKSGLALGALRDTFDIKIFTGGEMTPFARFPLYFGLGYQYNGLPQYENHSHSIPHLASLKWKWAGFSLGCNFRLTSFFGETPVFEPALLALVYVYFINNNRLLLGLKAANFDNFTCGNFGAYYLNLNSLIRLNKKLSLINEIELRQSGSIALTSNFYGIVYRGGAAFSW